MKTLKTLPLITALVMMLATVQANAEGQTYDPYDNYYSANYGIDMGSTRIASRGYSAITAAPRVQQQATSSDNDVFSDPRNFYNW